MNEVREQARSWLVRRAGGAFSDTDRRAFEAWYAADPAHAHAFDKAARVWRVLPQAAETDFIEAARSEARNAVQMLRQDARRVSWRGRAAFASLALVAAIGTGLWQLRVDSVEPAVAAAQTARGEQRILTLSDGTRVTLAAASELDWAIAPDARRLTLRRGQAFFEVATDAARPFVVAAGGAGTVTALGTAFDVRVEPGDVTVTLLEGRIAVQPATLPDTVATDVVAPTIVAAGEQVAISKAGVTPPRPARSEATAWRVGKLVFVETSLDEVVSEINRYSTRQVSIGDERLRTVRVNGVFRTANIDALVQALAASFPLRAVEDGRGGIVLLSSERS
jgi:transmembrane sensor